MKKETWKQLLQIIITILTAISGTLFVQSCVKSSAAQIDTWHRERGWKFGIGYHYVVRRDGSIELGRPEWMIGAHCVGHNAHSIGVCYEGGLDIRGEPTDTRTEAQKASLRQLLGQLRQRYPHALIVGHHDLNPQKDCPCFDAAKEYLQL